MESLLGQDETLEEFNRLTTEKPEILRLVDGMTDDLLEQIKEVDFDDWEDFSACTLLPCSRGMVPLCGQPDGRGSRGLEHLVTPLKVARNAIQVTRQCARTSGSFRRSEAS
jgi:hypothetical protein